MTQLVNKVALVTGASGGIGQEIAVHLAKAGASAVLSYAHSADRAKAVVENIEEHGGRAIALQADMSKVAEIRQLFQDAIAHFGAIDILINNAGTAVQASIADFTEEDYEKVFAVNVHGVLFSLQEAAKYVVEGGRVINISSSTTEYPSSGLSVYAASKAAEKTFTEVFAKESGHKGITVNSVMPGPTIPGMFSALDSDTQKQAAALSPFNRLGTPQDIADVVTFLASDEARWITGQHILTNSGATT